MPIIREPPTVEDLVMLLLGQDQEQRASDCDYYLALADIVLAEEEKEDDTQ
jgi:hypothetical protein